MSDCDVCIGVDDISSPEFFKSTLIVARKEHLCCECKEPIRRGDTYQKDSVKWDDTFHIYKTCRECAEIRNVFRCGGGWVYHGLWADMQEMAFPFLTTATKCFVLLSAVAKQKTLDRWNKWKFSEVHQ